MDNISFINYNAKEIKETYGYGSNNKDQSQLKQTKDQSKKKTNNYSISRKQVQNLHKNILIQS